MKLLRDLSASLAFLAIAILCITTALRLPDTKQAVEHLRSASDALDRSAWAVHGTLTGQRKNGDDGLLAQSKLLLSNARETANALKQTAQDANKIAKAQEQKTGQVTDNLIATAAAGHDALVKFGNSLDALNGVMVQVSNGTVPKLNSSIESLNGLVSDLRPAAKASTDLITAGTATVTELRLTIGTANALLADPDIKAIMGNLKTTTANTSETMGHLSLVTMDVHNMLNPRKATFAETLAITAAKALLGSAAGPLISHFWPLGIDVRNTVTTTPAR